MLTFDRLEDRALLSGRGAAHGRTFKNITFEPANHRVESMDVYEPAGRAPAGGWPALIAIHGGGWRRFDKGTFGGEIAGQFTGHGYAVVAVDYQLSQPGAPSWPANIEDVRATVGYLRDHAGEFGIDPRRLAAIGESAGGHLAALLATDPVGTLDTPSSGPGLPLAAAGDPPPPLVDAVIDFYGPTDLAALYATSPVTRYPVGQFLGGTPDQLAYQYRAASPVSHVAGGDPPMLLIHGTGDRVVPIAQAEEMAQALTASGVPNQLIAVPGAAHGFEFQPQGRRLLPRMLAFLDASLTG